MKKQILLIAATHGDEKIGLEIINKLRIKKLDKYFDYLIANPKALKKQLRFVDADLNRSYPGIRNSHYYENKRAYYNLIFAKKYQYIIDIHEASQGINDFIIVPKSRLPKSFPINLIDLEIVLLWPDPKGPLSQLLENAIELEFGMKNRKRNLVILKAEKTIESFIKYVYKIKKQEQLISKKTYHVYGKLMLSEFNRNSDLLTDFKKTKINNEKFYPLLVGQYLNSKIICYKMLPLRQN